MDVTVMFMAGHFRGGILSTDACLREVILEWI
jgi:hypothetical protein